ncbi:Uncharacterised protein [uncultured archaeon]|nr:Uncharacterised protein [uncultured archaeon]
MKSLVLEAGNKLEAYTEVFKMVSKAKRDARILSSGPKRHAIESTCLEIQLGLQDLMDLQRLVILRDGKREEKRKVRLSSR